MKRKILAFTLIFILLFSLLPILSVGAMQITDSGTITITAPAGFTLDGQTFEAYKIFDVAIDDNGTLSDLTDDAYAYTLNSAFSTFTGYTGTSLKEYLESNPTAEEMIALSNALCAFIADKSISATGSATGTTAASVTIDALPLGYYLLMGAGAVSANPDDEVVTALCSLTTTTPAATVVLKLDAPTINKEVYNADTDDWGEWTDVNIGDTVEFKLTSKVPNMNGYVSYTFDVVDSMSSGLTFDPSSINITVGGAYFDDNNYNYSGLTSINNIGPYESGNEFRITFDPQVFATLTAGDDIIITYSATLNSDAIIGAPGNPNKVYLEYSNNPHTNGKGRTPEPEVKVYTFKLDMYKYTGELGEITEFALAGAIFELRDANDDVIPFMMATNVHGGNPIYVVDKTNASGTVTSFTTPFDGRIELKGLDAGTYYLVEKTPPPGYNLLDAPIEVVIAHTNNAGTYTVKYGEETNEIYINGDGYIPVYNATGSIFPETGGIGRPIFYIVGTLIILGSSVTLAVYLKTSSKKKNAIA